MEIRYSIEVEIPPALHSAISLHLKAHPEKDIHQLMTFAVARYLADQDPGVEGDKILLEAIFDSA